jgi:SAM-dependent methyltransferase
MKCASPNDAQTVAYFEKLYGASSDPYGIRTRWYEQRKRDVTLAALPHARYDWAYEPGCGAGELTAALAQRCGAVLASDFSEHALVSARARTASLANVRIAAHALPSQWPYSAVPFDLIVLSEVGYFLEAAAMQQIATCCAESLGPDGVLVACHWRPDFAERALSTDAVHAALDTTNLACTVRHEEADFLIQVWCCDSRSVAQREGIR